ncbi:MAG: pilus assembly protein [Gammaproteobacteria bacterium HGW-Gammaproteobacteria-4]|jgi:type IV pilus assembly protein PilX|nr:MAG: pilus assembly protein [Gammaproteobacteria bacterium HGW-Gammaproteobacteria-4]
MSRLSVVRIDHAKRQRGVALVVVLILLLVMTLLGLASMRGTLLEERMSGNMVDRGLAFQAAEAALREAEALLVPTPPAFPAVGCTNGLCAQPVPALGVPERAVDPAFAGWRTAVADVGTLAVQPQFIIEALGPGDTWLGCSNSTPIPLQCEVARYRITARSVAADRAQIILQSTFTMPSP